MGAYQKGLYGVLACWAVRKSKCHRFESEVVDREVNLLQVEVVGAAGCCEQAVSSVGTLAGCVEVLGRAGRGL